MMKLTIGDDGIYDKRYFHKRLRDIVYHDSNGEACNFMVPCFGPGLGAPRRYRGEGRQ